MTINAYIFHVTGSIILSGLAVHYLTYWFGIDMCEKVSIICCSFDYIATLHTHKYLHKMQGSGESGPRSKKYDTAQAKKSVLACLLH